MAIRHRTTTRASKQATILRQLDSLPKTSSKLLDEVKAIESRGFWKLWHVTDNYLEFVNQQDLVLNHVNGKAKINTQLNFGRFRVRIFFNDAQSFCFPHFNNVGDRQKSHPHVFADGRICWGSGAEVAGEALANMEISKHLDLLAHILSNHNPDDPVYRIDAFLDTKRWNLIEPIPPWKKPEPIPKEDDLFCGDHCADCDLPIDECDCEVIE